MIIPRVNRRAVLALLTMTAGMLAGCGSTDRVRYKMTVEIDTPQGVKSGSAVREVAYRVPSKLLFPSIAEDRPQWRVRGEAVTVEMPDGQVLFALLTSGDGVSDYAGRDIWFIRRELNRDSFVLLPNPPRTTRPVIANPLPMLVRFRNIADPTTVEKVDPENLAASFGAGVKLRRTTVELTDDPVTTGIEKRLGWLAHSADGGLDRTIGVTAQPPLAQQVSVVDFRSN